MSKQNLLVLFGEGSPISSDEMTRGSLSVLRAVEGNPSWLALTNGQPVSDAELGDGDGFIAGVYELLLDLDGTSGSGNGGFLLAVGLDLDPGNEEEFEDWYNTEHLPNLARTSGVIRARRYRLQESVTADPPARYLALYDITSPEIFGNDDWRAAVNTPWTERLRRVFHPRVRTVYEPVDQG